MGKVDINRSVHLALRDRNYEEALGLLKYTQDVQSPIVAKPVEGQGARPRATRIRMKSWLLEKIG